MRSYYIVLASVLQTGSRGDIPGVATLEVSATALEGT